MSSKVSSEGCICEHEPECEGTQLFWISCDSELPSCPGKNWYHCVCVGLPNRDHSDMPSYICKDCSSKMPSTSEISSAIAAQSSAALTPDTESGSAAQPSVDPTPSAESSNLPTTEAPSEEAFAVEALVDHADDPDKPGTIAFLVKWLGYDSSENTWLNESELQACYGLVNRYRRSHKMPPTTVLKPIGGFVARKDISFNHANWITLDRVLKEVQQNSMTSSYSAGIPIAALDLSIIESPAIHHRQDTLFVALFSSHFVPILYIHSLNLCYVSESQNSLMQDASLRDQLSSDLGKPLRCVPSSRVLRADHCGAGAIGLALEFLRLYKTRDLSVEVISPPSGILNHLIAKLHPEPSMATQDWKEVNKLRIQYTCRHCKNYSKRDKRTVLSHERRCNFK